jgi:phosphate butyryltransferase
MAYANFEELVNRVKAREAPKRMAIAAAADRHSLEAALEARRLGLARPVLVGGGGKITALLEELGGAAAVAPGDIYDEPDDAAACRLAVGLVREGKADFLMKGIVDTKVILGAVVDKTAGLNRGGLMSHFAVFEVPGYHKLLSVVDAGIVPYPTLEQKRSVIENAVNVFRALGRDCPKVGVLACVEKVNPKMPETLEAEELARMNAAGEIKNCVINGPVSYDCAVSKEIADLKGYTGEISGDVDILVAPNIHAGNIMAKMLTCTCGAKMAGIVVGAACPIVLTSRGSSAEEKLLSIVLSAAVSGG